MDARPLGWTGTMIKAAVWICGAVLVWWAAYAVFDPPAYIFPGPADVFSKLATQWRFLLTHAGITLLEMVLGLATGAALGVLTALSIVLFRPARHIVLPLLVASQALPVFAIAPLLVIWLGFGLASKIAMATLIIYFPVASAFYDGLRRTEPHLLDLARLYGASPASTLFLLRFPAALPGLASGLRVAAAIAPITSSRSSASSRGGGGRMGRRIRRSWLRHASGQCAGADRSRFCLPADAGRRGACPAAAGGVGDAPPCLLGR